MTGKKSVMDMLGDMQEGKVDEAPELQEVALKAGEVIFERMYEHIPVNTPLPDGNEVSLPYVTSDKDEIKYLKSFAKHCGVVTFKEG